MASRWRADYGSLLVVFGSSPPPPPPTIKTNKQIKNRYHSWTPPPPPGKTFWIRAYYVDVDFALYEILHAKVGMFYIVHSLHSERFYRRLKVMDHFLDN